MVILTLIDRETLQFFFTCSGLAGAALLSFSNPIHSFFTWSWTFRPRSYAQTAFIPEFRIPLLDTVENRCCLLEFCSKSSLHIHNGRVSCVFQNAKLLLKFPERHIFYYCLLAANQGNYVGGLFLKNNLESFSPYRRKNYHDPLRSLFVANFYNVSRTYE